VTAVLLCPPGTDRDVWLAARQAGIGASEIAAVLGISPWDSPFSLFHKKANGWQTDDNPDMEAGRRMESAIADWAADLIDPNETLTFHPAGLYASAVRPWQLATPDRLVCDCQMHDNPFPGDESYQHEHPDGNVAAVLEVKHPYSWDGFGEDGTDEIPVYYRVQLLWQMDVMGVGEGYLGAYCNHQLRVYHLRRDDKDLAVMRAAGAAFWARLQAGDVPPVDEHTATLATLKQLHPSVQDFDVQVPLELAEGYRRARAAKARAAALVDRYEARVRAAIGDGRRAMYGKQLVASRSVFGQWGDSAELAAIDDEWPVVDRLNPGRAASYA
jgi:putative phage-type endonuclease